MPSIRVSTNESQGTPLPQGLDAPACLIGLSLSDAFRQLVLEDPEITLLGKMIVEQEGAHGDVFNKGQYPGPYVDFNWPLDITASDLAFQFIRPLIFVIPGPPLPEASKAVQQVSGLIAGRLRALRQMLVTGRIDSYGTFAKTGNFGPMHRLQWARRGLLIDVEGGDLLQETDRQPAVLWSGVIFEAPEPKDDPASHRPQLGAEDTGAFHVNAPECDGPPSNPISTGEGLPAARRVTPQRASIQAAIAAIWPEGIPLALPLKVRDQKIMDWQRGQSLAIASSKTIRRYLAAQAPPHS
jgi:hypothetical protein